MWIARRGKGMGEGVELVWNSLLKGKIFFTHQRVVHLWKFEWAKWSQKMELRMLTWCNTFHGDIRISWKGHKGWWQKGLGFCFALLFSFVFPGYKVDPKRGFKGCNSRGGIPQAERQECTLWAETLVCLHWGLRREHSPKRGQSPVLLWSSWQRATGKMYQRKLKAGKPWQWWAKAHEPGTQ